MDNKTFIKEFTNKLKEEIVESPSEAVFYALACIALLSILYR